MATIAFAKTIAAISNPWVQALATMAASYVDSMIINSFMPNQNIEGSRMQDLSLQSSAYGSPINVVYGTVRTSGNIIWGTNYVEHKKTESAGGKGGGGKTTSTTYTYSVSCAIGICEGPIAGISRVWADGTDVTDKFDFVMPTAANLRNQSYVKNVFGGGASGNTVQTKLYLGDETQEPDPWIEGIEGEGSSPAYRGLAYVVIKDLELSDYGNRIPSFTFEVVRTTYDLKAIVDEISAQAGLSQSDINTEDLSGIEIPGFTVSGDKTFRERVEQLMMVYNFDGVEHDGIVTFRRRANADMYIMELDDLGAKEGNEGEEKLFEITRKHDMELPKTVKVSYISTDKDYNSGSMSANRINCRSANESSVDLTFCLTDAEAKALAEAKLYEAWARRSSINFSTWLFWAFLAPGANLKLDVGDRTRMIQASKISFGQPGILKVEGTDTGSTIYKPLSRTADSEILPSVPKDPTTVQLEFLDLPRLPWDTSSDYVEYLAASASVFYGTNLYRTLDGVSYQYLQNIGTAATIGSTTTALGSGPDHVWDNANTLTVVLTRGTLESRPEIDVLNGYNAAVVGNEIVQFKTATLIAANTYQLSGLLRGRLGTEEQIGVHAIGDRFVLLNSGYIEKLPASVVDWGVQRNYKVGPETRAVTDALYQSVSNTNTGRIAKCWAPCHLQGERDGSGNLTMTWVRRARTGGDWVDNIDVPLIETYEKYEVDIMAGETVKRTITVTSPTAAYSAAEQTTDFGAPQGSISVRVYQINDLRGRGIAKGGTV